jgi:2-polyprenyl-3-methyl-5-hydroxy-6-metoxy-1,4-benzoquinol methylase
VNAGVSEDQNDPAFSPTIVDHRDQKRRLRRIVAAYDGLLVRAYCVVRFNIININMLHILALCMRRRTRVLEVGCGFGLFACYFASRSPSLQYYGIDIDAHRIDMARNAARRLGLRNVHFDCADASKPLNIDGQYDAIVMMDLLHHLNDDAKRQLLDTAVAHLAPGGRLILKDVTRTPFWKMSFTWLLDVLMTRGFEMWYWDPATFRNAVDASLPCEAYPITDWLPYPHIIYLFQKPAAASVHAGEPTLRT